MSENNSLSIAYAIRKRNAKKGAASPLAPEISETSAPTIQHESDAAGVVQQILAKKMACGGMAEGGDVEDLYDGMDPDALSKEDDGSEDNYAKGGMVKKSMLSRVVSDMRAKAK